MTDSIEAQTRATLERLPAAVRDRGLLAQVEFFAPDHLNHGFPSNRELVAEVLQNILTTFPDTRFEIIQRMVEGEWAIEFCWFNGTHLGKAQHPYVHSGVLTGIEPTGKAMRVHHVHLFRIQNGRITEHHGTRDDLDMARQLGIKLEPQPPVTALKG